MKNNNEDDEIEITEGSVDAMTSSDDSLNAEAEPAVDTDPTVTAKQQPTEAAEPAPRHMATSPEVEREPAPADEQATALIVSHRTALMDLPSLDDEAEPQEGPLFPEEPDTAPEPDPFDSWDTITADQGADLSHEPITSHVPMAGADAPKKRRWPLVVGSIAAAGLLVYAAGGVFFSSRFFPNTTVNGEDVSNMTVADLSAYVTNLGATYKTQVKGEGVDFVIEGADINFVYDGAAYGAEAGAQINAWGWPIELSNQHAYTVQKGISFDEKKLEELVRDALRTFNEGQENPTDATAKYDEAKKAFVIVPEKIGTKVKADTIVPMVLEGVSGMATTIELGPDNLKPPAVKQDDPKLVSAVEQANKLLNSKVTIRIADKDAKTIDSSLLKDWISLDDDLQIHVDRDAVREWAQGPLSDEFDTVGNKRTYTRPDGKEIEIEGGTYGWMLNGQELADAIADNLENGNTDAIDAPMKIKAEKWDPDGQEWGKRYIDADLSEQYVRMYDENGNEIWHSECVSGNTTENHGTVTGVFYIQDKETNTNLVGLDYDKDGQPDYESHVNYWMPFDGGYGLHDATWRGAFGGNIYTYNGSHGCINLPFTDAEQLFNMINVGDVVIVHY